MKRFIGYLTNFQRGDRAFNRPSGFTIRPGEPLSLPWMLRGFPVPLKDSGDRHYGG